MTELDLKQIERNVFRDCFQDGLADILSGVYFLLVGLFLQRGTLAPFVIFATFLFAPLLRGLKKHFTYPRIGYAELREGDPGPLPWFVLGSAILGLVALIVVLIAAGVIAQPAQWYRWTPIFFGIWLAGIFLGLGLNVRLVRYYVVAGVALACGPTFALLSLTGKLENIALFCAAAGVVLLVWGVVSFIRFLGKYPVPLARGANDID